jgi:tripartite-type tricarboxylate transporter receptor subunit TctC
MMRRRRLLAPPALALALAQVRPARTVVPAPPGGAVDLVARSAPDGLMGRRVLRGPGDRLGMAGGSAPRGFSAPASSAGLPMPPASATPPSCQARKIPGRSSTAGIPERSPTHDPLADSARIGRIATSPLLIIGQPDASRARRLGELAGRMRRDPRHDISASPGAGAMARLASEGFKRRVGAADAAIAQDRGTGIASRLADFLAEENAKNGRIAEEAGIAPE